ncbi:hypothetical protein Lal_00018150 [Lupinus albus]|uniref:Legumin-like protein n=2 Tax=Lupinus albus TaxID=3870 RepID=Q53I54_LUPAL|nr:hypothetical protein Lal_00018150 [Lupinus albus]CAI83773.2 legumin-like protein [Lupinus albus]
MSNKLLALSLFLPFLLLFFCGCFASTFRQQPQENECQFQRLNALEPDNTVQSEAGTIETWNPKNDELRCAGVALSRCTIQRNGLRRPFYTNAPQEIYIQQGRGIFGMIFPGCGETYEEPQESEKGQGPRPQDRHQKVEHFKEGDIIAVPTGIPFWMYNDGQTPVVAITLIDTTNLDNQLDQIPRRFYLSGNQEQEFLQYQEKEGGQGQQQEGGNVLSGFDDEFLEEALSVNKEIVRNIKGKNDDREGGIVEVKGGLKVIIPPTMRPRHGREEEEEEEEEDERRGDRRRRHPHHHHHEEEEEEEEEWSHQVRRVRRPHRHHHHRKDRNGLEETLCTMKLRHNIGESTSPDAYNPQAGRFKTLTSIDFPILGWLGLAAEHGSIYKNALFVPYYNVNANSILYVLNGSAWFQVVDCSGNAVFNGELNEGQVLTIPQNYAAAIKSLSDNFRYVAFKTNDIPQIATLAGANSEISALPLEVVAHAFNLNRDQARQLKNNNPYKFLVPPPQSQLRAVA